MPAASRLQRVGAAWPWRRPPPRPRGRRGGRRRGSASGAGGAEEGRRPGGRGAAEGRAGGGAGGGRAGGAPRPAGGGRRRHRLRGRPRRRRARPPRRPRRAGRLLRRDLSRSTKMLHGGVRYLEKAVFNLDYGQLKLVFNALIERKQAIENAPHLCHPLPCMTPCFDWLEVVYYWMGLKLYDLIAGRRMLHLSRYYSANELFELFPTLARDGRNRSLKGTVVYYDGQTNDSR
uniref:glycerol-3-phosphate dehydrogenase n=1 Tax=Ananas comosus var. bracteatus TaxID=296719 RepID=A0A6V7PYM5_ANACO|nr:unnamed protein product [Ananas comosus var. bracteatus]